MSNEQIDYRDLLKKYMEHVGKCEGITFLSDLSDGSKEFPNWPHWSDSLNMIFSHEEIMELNRIEREITTSYAPSKPIVEGNH